MIRYERQLEGGGRIVIVCTERPDGDFRVPAEGEVVDRQLHKRRAKITSHPWFWIRQQHGAKIAAAESAEGTLRAEASGQHADASITAEASLALSITSADCLPIALWNEGSAKDSDQAIGVVHAGWRGLSLEIIQRAAEAMRTVFGAATSAFIGPHICASCYEFSQADAEQFIDRWGSDVYRDDPLAGTPALDMGRIAELSLREAGVRDIASSGRCTACEPERWFSHRARQEQERMAMVVWREQG